VVAVNVQVNSKLLDLAASVEKDVSNVLNEALHLWLKKKIITCPITGRFCININEPCNNCDITKRSKAHFV
jgi:hypothetical protein